MNYTNIQPDFDTAEDKNMLILILLLSIVFTFIPSAIFYFIFPEKMKKATKEIVLALLNIEIIMFVIGIIIYPIMVLINLFICLKAISDINNKQPVKIPVLFTLFTANTQNIENKDDELKP